MRLGSKIEAIFVTFFTPASLKNYGWCAKCLSESAIWKTIEYGWQNKKVCSVKQRTV